MMRVVIGYPSREKELEILDTHGVRSTFLDLQPVVTVDDVHDMIAAASQVAVSASVKNYIVDLVEGNKASPRCHVGSLTSLRPVPAKPLQGTRCLSGP